MNRVQERLYDDKYGFRIIQLVLFGMFLLFSQLLSSAIVDISYKIFEVGNSFTLFTIRGILDVAIFLIAFIFFIRKILKVELSYFRITPFKINMKWIVIGLFLPLGIVSFYFIFTHGEISYDTKYSLAANITYALKLGLVAGITEELLFRGYMMRILEERWNLKVAVIAPSILFATLHAFKGIDMISFLQLLVAGTLVGIMFSLITIESKNVWNAVIVHTLWNIIILGVFRISPDTSYSAMINLTIKNNNRLITGGDFGIEAALPAILCYIVVSSIAMINLYGRNYKTN